jgi:hypothetical protein
VLLWAGAVGIQGYFYNEASPDLIWRAPAASFAVTFYIGIWCWINHGNPRGTYGSVFDFETPSNDEKFSSLVWVKKDQTEVRYHWDGIHWVDNSGHPFRRSTSDGVVEEIRAEPSNKESGKTAVFKVDLTPDGKFKDPQNAHYIEEDGEHRVMTEDSLGRVSTPKRGLLFGNLLLNGLHFAAWFVCLWLLLRFQWSHALGLAIALWLALSLSVVPFLLAKTSSG